MIAELTAVFNINFKPTVQTVTTQIVYKFNGGLPAPVYPATPAMATNWTGFYVNAGVGYGLWNADSTDNRWRRRARASSARRKSLGGKGYLGRDRRRL